MTINRRALIGSIGAVFVAGCTGSLDAEESGTVRYPDDAVHNLDVNEGDTLRVEIDNEEGMATFVSIDNPSDEVVVDTDVETEDTITYQAEESGVFMVWITNDGTSSYEIHIDSE